MTPLTSIRAARNSELGLLQEIEVSAGQAFCDWNMPEIASDPPPAISQLAEYHSQHRLWVSVNENDFPVAYVLVSILDENAHIDQVSVHTDYAGHKIGRGLIESVVGWATERKLAAITLTTFRDIPWNAPYYQRCGFRVLEAEELSAGLRRIVGSESARGLDRWPRVCMQRELDCQS